LDNTVPAKVLPNCQTPTDESAAMTPIAMVIDRPMGARIAKDVHEFGGAWEEMFHTWQALSPMQYVVMLADTKERIRLRAPLTMMAVDDDALRQVLRHCCDQLAGKKCRWALFVEAGSTAEQITRAEILRDATTEGAA
jgi:hypothetical protein